MIIHQNSKCKTRSGRHGLNGSGFAHNELFLKIIEMNPYRLSL